MARCVTDGCALTCGVPRPDAKPNAREVQVQMQMHACARGIVVLL